MADENDKAGQGDPASAGNGVSGAAASGGEQGQRPGPPPVHILTQYVKDLSFENPNGAQLLVGGGPSPQISVNVDVRTNKLAENRYEVILTIKGDAKSESTQAFMVELSYAGVVDIRDATREQLAPLLMIEVPRLLFPFARAVIAEATRNGGYPPMMVQPIDFTALFRRQLQALKERRDQAAAEGEASADLSDTTPSGSANA